MDNTTESAKAKRAYNLAGTEKFAQIPLEALSRIKRVPDLKVYLVLAAFSNKESGECFPSRRVISDLGAIHIAAVSPAVHRLNSAGLINVTERKGTSNLYVVYPPTVFASASQRGENQKAA